MDTISDLRAISALQGRVEEMDTEIFKHTNMLADMANRLQKIEMTAESLDVLTEHCHALTKAMKEFIHA